MKKLLVLAAVSAMAFGAKAEYEFTGYTISSADFASAGFQGAKAVWDMGTDMDAGTAQFIDALYFHTKMEDYNTWAEQYADMEEDWWGDVRFTPESDGTFSYYNEGSLVSEWALLVTDKEGLIPGANYSIYRVTSHGEGEYAEFGGGITLGELLVSGTLETDSPTPAPEPTSGLLLLLGVAGLALKRKRA